MKKLLALLMVSQSVWSAGYVPWDPVYNLWMPAISSNTSNAILLQQKNTLPFAEPTATFAQPPGYKKVPFDAQNALLMDQKYFAVDAPEQERTTVVLKVEALGNEKVRLRGLSPGAPLPQSLILIKSKGMVTVLGNWPKELPLEDRQKVIEAGKAVLNRAPEGQYSGRIGVE